MRFSETLRDSISNFHLLKHPFYQAWNNGELSHETLQEYARQYFKHVEVFPRYLSATHSLCEDISQRRLLLENLADEEGFNGTDHPELWLRFCEALGVEREQIHGENAKLIQPVIDSFMHSARASFAEGLASLYAYEYQVPEVAETKIEGLKKHYGVSDERGLSFFETHKKADVYHREACEELLDSLKPSDQQLALEAAQKSAKSLWDFLSGIHEFVDAA